MQIRLFPFNWNQESYLLFQAKNMELEEEIENLKELDKYKDRVLANVTHDLRTPLNGSIFFLDQALLFCQENEEIKKNINLAKINCDLLMSLINDILDLSQLKENKMNLITTEFNLIEECEFIKNLMKIQADYKKINVKKENSYLINNDLRRLKQVLINLISNALKFTLKGYFTNSAKNTLKVEVKDSGVGIDPDKISKLSQPFVTFDNNGLNKQGIGLGLSICKMIIQYLGPNKELMINSKLNFGSTFSFYLYKDISINVEKQTEYSQYSGIFNSDLIQEIPENDYIEKKNKLNIYFEDHLIKNKSTNLTFKQRDEIEIKQNLNILIVDDNIFNLMALNCLLQSNDANNGLEAFEKFCENNKKKTLSNFDIIVMDCEMPIMNGYDSAKLINKKINDENYIKCKIIAYTSCLTKDIEFEILRVGMQKFLLKPAKKDDLLKLITELMN